MTDKRIGRPRLFDEPMDAQLSLNATSAQVHALRQIARDNGTSLAGVIREAVTEYAASYREQYPHRRRR